MSKNNPVGNIPAHLPLLQDFYAQVKDVIEKLFPGETEKKALIKEANTANFCNCTAQIYDTARFILNASEDDPAFLSAKPAPNDIKTMPGADTKLLEQALREAKDFAKEVRAYLYEASKKQELTKEEDYLYACARSVHVHTNDELLQLVVGKQEGGNP